MYIKVIFLGTNGWYDTPTGSTTCVLMETKASYIVLDAGNGIYKIDSYIKSGRKPIYLFLSHFHLDHVIGLHILNKFKFAQGLTICCPGGGKGVLDSIMRQPYTIGFSDLSFKVDIKELGAGTHEGFPFNVKSKEVVHSSRCFGYRFEIDGKVAAYCTDTGYCPAILELAEEADLLIAECSLKSGQRSGAWPHLNPGDAGRLARESGAKKLALIHFDADNYRTFAERKKAGLKAKAIFKNTVAAKDGMILKV